MSAPMLDPAAAYVGAVLHLDVPTARTALGMVADDDVPGPTLRAILTAARSLVAGGVAPDPVAVLALLRANGTATGADSTREFTITLADVLLACPLPAAVATYAAAVLDESVRRRCMMLAARIDQAAGTSSLDGLVDTLDSECRAVRAVLNRRAVAAGDAPTRLRGVTAA